MEKAYLTVKDIQERYDYGINKARSILRDIRRANNGGKLGAGKILPSELKHWENLVDGQYKERL